jgi:hypothetical protein
MLSVNFKLNEVTRTTILRFSKNLYPYSFVNFLKEKDSFTFLESNKKNHVFKYNGSVENAEFDFNIYLVTFDNLNNKISMD